MHVLEAQLALLLRLSAAGGAAARTSSAKALVDAGGLGALAGCRALDLEPEEPGGLQVGLGRGKGVPSLGFLWGGEARAPLQGV